MRFRRASPARSRLQFSRKTSRLLVSVSSVNHARCGVTTTLRSANNGCAGLAGSASTANDFLDASSVGHAEPAPGSNGALEPSPANVVELIRQLLQHGSGAQANTIPCSIAGEVLDGRFCRRPVPAEAPAATAPPVARARQQAPSRPRAG